MIHAQAYLYTSKLEQPEPRHATLARSRFLRRRKRHSRDVRAPRPAFAGGTR